MFTKPLNVIKTRSACEVRNAFIEADCAVAAGYYVAGYVAYEAAAELDDALAANNETETDLVWLGIFRHSDSVHGASHVQEISLSPWKPDTLANDYCEMVRAIREAIARGETYQVNLTTRLRSQYTGSPAAFYKRIAEACEARYCALLEKGDLVITSFSPELFFQINQDRIVVRPMKGTAARGRTSSEDELSANALHASVKDRAENVMIVDLMRNDLGRICLPGTISVPKLFTVEPYPTIWQLTSEIRAQLKPLVKLKDVFEALFPCGSITGAPKIAAMRKIAQLEKSPRGIYCGAIGFATPNGEATFNVAIRTAVFNQQKGTAVFGSGGGITWDSAPHAEYAEMLAKALVIQTHSWEMALLESMLLIDGEIPLVAQHINRVFRSAAFFGVKPDRTSLIDKLACLAVQHSAGKWKVRATVSLTGAISAEAVPVLPYPRVPLRAVLSSQKVSSTDFRLYHKTTDRSIYTSQSRLYPGYDEILMQNERDELTEFLNGNLVLESKGKLFTPPVQCGLLPGIQREQLITSGDVAERFLYSHHLRTATRLWFVNSVRGMVPVEVDIIC